MSYTLIIFKILSKLQDLRGSLLGWLWYTNLGSRMPAETDFKLSLDRWITGPLASNSLVSFPYVSFNLRLNEMCRSISLTSGVFRSGGSRSLARDSDSTFQVTSSVYQQSTCATEAPFHLILRLNTLRINTLRMNTSQQDQVHTSNALVIYVNFSLILVFSWNASFLY